MFRGVSVRVDHGYCGRFQGKINRAAVGFDDLGRHVHAKAGPDVLQGRVVSGQVRPIHAVVLGERKQAFWRVPHRVHGDRHKADVLREVVLKPRLDRLHGVRDDWTGVRAVREHEGDDEDFLIQAVQTHVFSVLIDEVDLTHRTAGEHQSVVGCRLYGQQERGHQQSSDQATTQSNTLRGCWSRRTLKRACTMPANR